MVEGPWKYRTKVTEQCCNKHNDVCMVWLLTKTIVSQFNIIIRMSNKQNKTKVIYTVSKPYNGPIVDFSTFTFIANRPNPSLNNNNK